MSTHDNDQHNADRHDDGHPESEDAKVSEGTQNLQALGDEAEAKREQAREHTNALPNSIDEEDPPLESDADREERRGAAGFPEEVPVLPVVRPHP